MTITTYYCAPQDVSSYLRVPVFSSSTSPTDVEVGDLINENEEYIESETMNAWREKIVDQETHHLDYPEYQLRDGTAIFLENRKISSFDSTKGDKIEVWNGVVWEDYLANKVQGRNKDFWVDYNLGILFIKTFPRTVPRNFAVRVTYRFGALVKIPKQIKKCAIYLTVIDLLQSDDRSVLLPEGTSNIPIQAKSDYLWERARQIIDSNTEIKVVAMN